jgi:hypothetical protein
MHGGLGNGLSPMTMALAMFLMEEPVKALNQFYRQGAM